MAEWLRKWLETPETSETTADEGKTKSELSIEEFLQKIEFSKYIDIFIEEEVTMDILKTFNDDDLRNIGITKYGPRKKILNSIASLEHQGKILDSIYFQTFTIFFIYNPDKNLSSSRFYTN